MVTSSVEINRTPEDVFAYVAELDRHGEWQEAIVSARKEPEGPTRLGTRNIEKRRVPGGAREFTTEVVEFDPPRRLMARGLDGPIRPVVRVTIHPLDGGARSRVTLDLELVGHGIGKLFALLAIRQARTQVPKDQARLKERLERRG
jgi:uncharacterized protein YndB with AHSA1/START domain